MKHSNFKSPRGVYNSDDVVYKFEFPKVVQPEIKEIFNWIEEHCYPNVFDYQGWPTVGPDRKIGELVFEDDLKADELVQLLKRLDSKITRNAASFIPF